MQLSGWRLSLLQVKTMEGVLCKRGHVRGRSYALRCHHSESFQLAHADNQRVVCSYVLYTALRKVGTQLDSAQSMDFTAEFDPEGDWTHACAVLAPRVRRVHLQWRRAWMSQCGHILPHFTFDCILYAHSMLWHVVAPQATRANSWKIASRAGARFSLRTGMPMRRDWWLQFHMLPDMLAHDKDVDMLRVWRFTQGQWYFDQMHGHGVLAHWAPDQGVLVYEVLLPVSALQYIAQQTRCPKIACEDMRENCTH